MARCKVIQGIDLSRGSFDSAAAGGPVLFGIPGLCQGQPARWGVSRDVLCKNIGVFGGIGSGKTNATLQLAQAVRDNLTAGSSMLVLDPKGDYGSVAAGPRDVTLSESGSTANYNLFKDVVGSSDMRETAALVAEALFSGLEAEGNQAFFRDSAAIITAEVIEAMARQTLIDEGFACLLSNRMLFAYLRTATPAELAFFCESVGVRSSVNALLGSGDGSQGLGVRGEIARVATAVRGDWDNDAPMDEAVGMGDFLAGGRVLRLVPRVSASKPCPLVGVAVELYLKLALDAPAADGVMHIALLEELGTQPRFSMLPQSLAFGRSKGLGVIAVMQAFSQLERIYGREDAQTLAGCMQSLVAFPVHDEPTRKLLADRYGQALYEVIYVAANGAVQRETVSESVIAPWHLADLQLGQAVLCPPIPARPLIFQFERRG